MADPPEAAPPAGKDFVAPGAVIAFHMALELGAAGRRNARTARTHSKGQAGPRTRLRRHDRGFRYTVKDKLKRRIAKTHKDDYWSDTVPQPGAKRVGYNDMSIVDGGKFDLPANWCIVNSPQCRHEGHRIGTHVDARRRNMTASQQQEFASIVEDNDGDPQVHSRGTPNEHWRLEF